MKYVRHVFLFLIGLVGAVVVDFYRLNSKNLSTTRLISPAVETTSTPTPRSVFAIEMAPSNSLQGRIARAAGEIDYQSRIATESSVLQNLHNPVLQGETYATKADGQLQINFDDAVNLSLANETELNIIQTLPADLVFSQISGTVTYRKMGSYPVTVRTSYLLSEINGQTKIVRNPGKNTVVAMIESGETTFVYNDENYVSQKIVAKSGQVFSFNYDKRQGVLK